MRAFGVFQTFGAAFLLFHFLISEVAFAQSDPQDGPLYTFVAIDVPLSAALDRFIEQTGVNVAVDIELIEEKKAFCRAVDQPVESVFRCLLEESNLDFVRLSSGTYVIVEPVKAPPELGELTGKVVDQESGEPLANAHVLLADAGTGDVTNDAGRFAFANLKPGVHRIVVTYIGYHDYVSAVNVLASSNTRVELGLHSEPIVSSPIVINGLLRRLPSEELEAESADALELTENPGSNDVVLSMNTIVGIRVGDTMADVHVQGGDSGEHQYRLDGAPVFIPIPNGGIVGPFSPFALEKFTIHKAGFNARYGSQLSGVIEAEHRLTSIAGNTFDIQVDPLSVSGRAVGRLGRRDALGANWMVAARKGLWSIYQPKNLADHFSDWSRPDLFLIQALAVNRQPDSRPRDERNYFEHLDEPVRRTLRESSFQDRFDFYDLHTATRVNLGPLRSLYASFYLGGNALGDEKVIQSRFPDPSGVSEDQNFLSFENGYDWRNRAANVRYEHILGGRTFVEWSGWYSLFRLTQNSNQQEYESFRLPLDSLNTRPRPHGFSADSLASLGFATDDKNRIAEYGLRSEINHAIGNRHFIAGGLEAVRTGSEFVLDLQLPRGPGRPLPARARIDTQLWRWAAYLEDKYSISERTTLNAGIRLTYLPDRQEAFAEPRLALRHDVSQSPLGAWAFRGAVGLYRQFVNQFDVASLGVNALLPGVRFWMPLGGQLSPPKAYHATAAILVMPDPSWQFRVEGYYKWQPRLLVIDYANPALRSESAELFTDQDDLLIEAEGYAYGGALSAQKKTGRWTTVAEYEYSVADQRVENRFNGEYVTVPWNVPHRMSASFDVAAGDHLTFLGRLQYSIGRSWAFRDAYYNYLEPDDGLHAFAPYDLSDPASHRLPVITELDLGVSYTRRFKGVQVQLRLDLANILSNTNVEEWSLIYDANTQSYVKIERPLSPFLPSLVMRLGW